MTHLTITPFRRLTLLASTAFIAMAVATVSADDRHDMPRMSAERDHPVKLEIPTPSKDIVVTKPIIIGKGKHRDFQGARLIPKGLGDGSQKEGQRPILALMRGASVSNLIIGKPGADGVYCHGDNLLENVYFEDVGEDALTIKGGPVTWDGGGARRASDKVVQMNHKGPFIGRNLIFEDFGIAVRGNGMKKHINTPFRVELFHVRGVNGRSLVKLSSKGSRVTMDDVVTWKVKSLTSKSNGAESKQGEVYKFQ